MKVSINWLAGWWLQILNILKIKIVFSVFKNIKQDLTYHKSSLVEGWPVGYLRCAKVQLLLSVNLTANSELISIQGVVMFKTFPTADTRNSVEIATMAYVVLNPSQTSGYHFC